MFTVALFTIAKIWKQPESIYKSMDNEDLGDIGIMEYYSLIIKNKTLPFVKTLEIC